MRQRQIDEKQASIKQYEFTLNVLRQDWTETNSKTFTFEHSDTCPACGQALLPEYLDAARGLATGTFNTMKATKLEAITAEGHALKARVDELNDEVSKLQVENTNGGQRLTALLEETKSAQAAITALENKETPASPAYLAKLRKLEEDVEKLTASHGGAIIGIKLALSALDEKIAECEATMAQIKQRETGLQRIEELKVAERTLAEEFEKLEGELYLTDEFVRTKVTLLEDRINSRFMMARFKLFNQLVNGGIEEVCETIYLGVPYSSALNNSARINIGLDIINTLSDHFQFVAPIWIDNAEAITALLQTKGQQIRLYVNEADKVLRIEGAKEAMAK
jgi:chromosome segregation ATPase